MKPIPHSRKLNQTALDEGSKAMILDGVGITQLSRLFRVDAKGIPERIRSIPPCGERGGNPIWKVHEVAPYLSRQSFTPEDIIGAIKKMNPQDLPPLLTKEFWNGARARLAFEQADGDLWPTSQVAEYLGEVFQILRLAWMTLPDDVERTSSLSDEQRRAIRRLADGKMEEIRVALTERFQALASAEQHMGGAALEGAASPIQDAPEEPDDI